jgi:hypothetical protein
VLRYVASGPFGDAATPTIGWAAVGLFVHFAIMACMATAYMVVAARMPALLRHPISRRPALRRAALVIMYWVVKPCAGPRRRCRNSLYGIANQLFSHCILVGLPIAFVASRLFRMAHLRITRQL